MTLLLMGKEGWAQFHKEPDPSPPMPLAAFPRHPSSAQKSFFESRGIHSCLHCCLQCRCTQIY